MGAFLCLQLWMWVISGGCRCIWVPQICPPNMENIICPNFYISSTLGFWSYTDCISLPIFILFWDLWIRLWVILGVSRCSYHNLSTGKIFHFRTSQKLFEFIPCIVDEIRSQSRVNSAFFFLWKLLRCGWG